MNLKKQLKKLEKEQLKNHEERMAKCVPLAKKILNLIGTEDLMIGDINDSSGNMRDDANKSYINVAGKILEEMKEADMLYGDKIFIFQLVFQAFEKTRDKVIDSLEQSFDVVLATYFEKDFMEVSMNDLDKKMQSALKDKK